MLSKDALNVCSSAFRRRLWHEIELITFHHYRLKAGLQTIQPGLENQPILLRLNLLDIDSGDLLQILDRLEWAVLLAVLNDRRGL